MMSKSEETGSPGWGASFFMQTTEDVAKAVAAAVNSPRPSVVFSSDDDSSGSKLQKLQRHVSRVLKGLSSPPEVVKNGTYNPELLTTQKRQWASFQLQYLEHRMLREPSRLFENVVVVGLPPDCDIKALERQYIARKADTSGKLRVALNHSRVEPNIEPQVLFVYPREKRLPLKYKDLLSFCFPGGVEVHAVERTPSMSEINEILLGQEHLKQSDLSYVFRLQVGDDSTLYGCCMLVEEIVQKPSRLLSIPVKPSACPTLSRHLLTTRRCYCILSRVPFFELHFGVLNSIFTEERLERLTKDMVDFSLESIEGLNEEENEEGMFFNNGAAEDMHTGTTNNSQSCSMDDNGKLSLMDNGTNERVSDNCSSLESQMPDENVCSSKKVYNDNVIIPIHIESETVTVKEASDVANLEDCPAEELSSSQQEVERRSPHAVLPLMRCYQYESSDSSPSFQGSPCEDRNFRSDVDDTETEEASFSGQDDSSDNIDILEWAKANDLGSLQILCEYYRLPLPARGTTLHFQPLEHLHPLEYHRPNETVLHGVGSNIDLRSCSSSLQLVEAHTALVAEEEARALSAWTVACLCGSLRLENVLTLFAGALLEKQIMVVCSNLGILSASVLSIVPLIRPYRWQSLLMPVLPNDMLDFLDAPVPYIVGIKNKTGEVQSKNVIVVDVNKNQVKASSIPQLPRHKELFASLSPYHAKLVGESYLGKKRPVHECTDAQIQAAQDFLAVLRSYLDSLCSNLRSHTITNVQSNNDKVSLLLKESFIDSFPSHDRPFMKLFVDTQLFSVHTDLVLSFFQKE